MSKISFFLSFLCLSTFTFGSSFLLPKGLEADLVKLSQIPFSNILFILPGDKVLKPTDSGLVEATAEETQKVLDAVSKGEEPSKHPSVRDIIFYWKDSVTVVENYMIVDLRELLIIPGMTDQLHMLLNRFNVALVTGSISLVDKPFETVQKVINEIANGINERLNDSVLASLIPVDKADKLNIFSGAFGMIKNGTQLGDGERKIPTSGLLRKFGGIISPFDSSMSQEDENDESLSKNTLLTLENWNLLSSNGLSDKHVTNLEVDDTNLSGSNVDGLQVLHTLDTLLANTLNLKEENKRGAILFENKFSKGNKVREEPHIGGESLSGMSVEENNKITGKGQNKHEGILSGVNSDDQKVKEKKYVIEFLESTTGREEKHVGAIPTPEEIIQFFKDRVQNAFESVSKTLGIGKDDASDNQTLSALFQDIWEKVFSFGKNNQKEDSDEVASDVESVSTVETETANTSENESAARNLGKRNIQNDKLLNFRKKIWA